MKKKIAARCEVAPEVIGHFEIKADLILAKHIRESEPSEMVILNPRQSPKGTARRLRAPSSKSVDAVRLHLQSKCGIWRTKVIVPPDIAKKMRLGNHYKIQCTIVEVKEDAES